MKVGDIVKIKTGKHAGKIGTIKSARTSSAQDCFDVEIPRVDRWCFFVETEIEPVPPTPLRDVNLMVRLAAQNVVNSWRRGMQPPIIERDIQILEKALLN